MVLYAEYPVEQNEDVFISHRQLKYNYIIAELDKEGKLVYKCDTGVPVMMDRARWQKYTAKFVQSDKPNEIGIEVKTDDLVCVKGSFDLELQEYIPIKNTRKIKNSCKPIKICNCFQLL